MGSWAAVEPNGTRLPSIASQPRLGASLPSHERALCEAPLMLRIYELIHEKSAGR